MKKRICILLLSPILLSAVACGGKQSTEPMDKDTTPDTTPSTTEDLGPCDVVLISGQSNAVGCTRSIYLPDTMGVDKYDEYFSGYSTIQIAYDCWTKDWPTADTVTFYSQNVSRKNNFVKVALGQGNGQETFGPEIGIAEAMHEKYANKLFLIKYACGASNLKDDWATRNSPMYPRFIEYVKLQMNHLKEKGYTPTIKAFCWMQGEGDSYGPDYYGVYQDNLREFVGNVRSDLKELAGNKDMPFIDAGISNASVWPKPEKVNEAKIAFAAESENNYFIDTIAAGMHTNQEPAGEADLAHYDSESQILLGHLFAEAFEPFLDK